MCTILRLVVSVTDESELIQEKDSLKKKMKGDVALKLKSEGNRIQHTYNVEV
jgi:hypothetical protein